VSAKPTRKRRDIKPGTLQFRSFTDVADPENRLLKSQLHHAAKYSNADSLLRKFSWEDDQ
jgi:hypothetical protein